jgi:GntR family transcriptional repressor for pyruvate dehydrogenase complex
MYLGLIKSPAGDGAYIQSSLGRVLNQHFQWMILLGEVRPLEIYELRTIIEPEVAAIAAKRATKKDIDSLQAALHGMAQCVTPESFLTYDIQFHETFARASGNMAIQTTMRMLYHATTEARNAVMPFVGNLSVHWRRHERVFRSLRDNKPELARKAARGDLEYAESLIHKHLASRSRRSFKDRSRARSEKEDKRKNPESKGLAPAF